MSVTITVNNNMEYCRKNSLVGKKVYECQCKYFPEVTDCEECKGTKEVSFDTFPFELNISNRNFQTLWSVLCDGFDASRDDDWVGTVKPHIIINNLKSLDASLLLRENNFDEKGKVKFYEFGITQQQVEYYIEKLKPICDEAMRREEDIFWC